MQSAASSTPGETRFSFRVLAGMLAVILLLVGLPAALSEAHRNGRWEAWIGALSCVYAGIGFIGGATNGRWFWLRNPGRGVSSDRIGNE